MTQDNGAPMKKIKFNHPLIPSILDQFLISECHDAMTISCALSGVTGLSGRGMQAYKVGYCPISVVLEIILEPGVLQSPDFTLRRLQTHWFTDPA